MIELVGGKGLAIYLIALIFFIWVFFRNGSRFKRTKNKIVRNYYLRAVVISVLMLLTIVLGLFNQILWSTILFFVLVIISVLLLPATLKARRVENEKILAHVHSKDLVLVDLFTQRGWLKMAQRFGCWNATLIVFGISWILLFILSTGLSFLVYEEFDFVRILVSAGVISGLSSAFFYLTVKRTKDKVIFWGR